MVETHQVDGPARRLFSFLGRNALVKPGQRDVVGDAAVGHEVEGLENETDAASPQGGAVGFAQFRGVEVVYQDRSAAGAIQQPGQVQQRRLAGTGMTDDGHHVPVVYGETARLQRFDGNRTGECPGHVTELEDLHRRIPTTTESPSASCPSTAVTPTMPSPDSPTVTSTSR